MKKYLAEWEIAKVDDHKAVALFEVTDMEAFKEIFTTPKSADFHTKHNLVDTFYTLEKLSWLNPCLSSDRWSNDGVPYPHLRLLIQS